MPPQTPTHFSPPAIFSGVKYHHLLGLWVSRSMSHVVQLGGVHERILHIILPHQLWNARLCLRLLHQSFPLRLPSIHLQLRDRPPFITMILDTIRVILEVMMIPPLTIVLHPAIPPPLPLRTRTPLGHRHTLVTEGDTIVIMGGVGGVGGVSVAGPGVVAIGIEVCLMSLPVLPLRIFHLLPPIFLLRCQSLSPPSPRHPSHRLCGVRDTTHLASTRLHQWICRDMSPPTRMRHRLLLQRCRLLLLIVEMSSSERCSPNNAT